MPKIHLVTYATPRFKHRQWILGLSARLNRITDTVTSWDPRILMKAGFQQCCPDIQTTERGSGFWAWKPFIILSKLQQVQDGDYVFYCDVGRRFPYKVLDRKLTPFIAWIQAGHQSSLPGLSISWRGPMSVWTKRDAFVHTGMDDNASHEMAPIQASFSLWRACPQSQNFLRSWLTWCIRRELISDDISGCGLPELPDFFEHRHDQALLTLRCKQSGYKGLEMPAQAVTYDTRNPSEVLHHVYSEPRVSPSIKSSLLMCAILLLSGIEFSARIFLSFGSQTKEHPLAD